MERGDCNTKNPMVIIPRPALARQLSGFIYAEPGPGAGSEYARLAHS